MSKRTFKILIVGDELGLNHSLMNDLRQAGHQVVHCERQDDALEKLARDPVDFALVDCMLPGTINGVDFVVNVRMNPRLSSIKFILMSGIFTDKEFIKEAIEKTKAIKFIEKKMPFKASEVLNVIEAHSASAEELPPIRKQLYQIFAKDKVSSREKRKLIESLEEVNGYDLPFIYSLLVETRSSGYLNIYEKNGSVSGVSFSEGCIVGVDAEDKTTYLGEMLIQSGYATPAHVQRALTERTNQKIGSRLIGSNQLSPHAFDVILIEQMNIRLSRTVADHSVRVNFASAEVEKTEPNIDSEQLQFYLHDWIASKINTNWLKALYLVWSGNRIQTSPNFRDDHPALEMGLIQAVPGLVSKIMEGQTLSQIVESKHAPESAVYKALHFLLTKGLIIFGGKQAFLSVKDQFAALKKMWADVQSKSAYEIADMLGSENISDQGIEELLGTAPGPENAAAQNLWETLKKKLLEAGRHSNDSVGRAKFQEDSASRQAEARVKASQMMEEAKQKLGMNQFGPALLMLQEVQRLVPQMEGIHTLLAWAKIGQITPQKKASLMKEIEFELVQVSAEERYDALYPMVLGLFQKARGDLQNSKKNLERAIAMNSSLITARRELALVQNDIKKEGDLFGNVDFKGMVAGFFKRK